MLHLACFYLLLGSATDTLTLTAITFFKEPKQTEYIILAFKKKRALGTRCPLLSPHKEGPNPKAFPCLFSFPSPRYSCVWTCCCYLLEGEHRPACFLARRQRAREQAGGGVSGTGKVTCGTLSPQQPLLAFMQASSVGQALAYLTVHAREGAFPWGTGAGFSHVRSVCLPLSDCSPLPSTNPRP